MTAFGGESLTGHDDPLAKLTWEFVQVHDEMRYQGVRSLVR